jgi:hypothetical protein
MLDAHGPLRDARIEHVAVEAAGDGLVVANASEPGSGREAPIGVGQDGCERSVVARHRWTDEQRPARRRPCVEMDVMVVESGDDAATGGVQHPVGRTDGELGGDGDDPLPRDAHIGASTRTEVGVAYDEVRHATSDEDAGGTTR